MGPSFFLLGVEGWPFLLGVGTGLPARSGGWPLLLGVGFGPTWSGGWPSFSGLAFLLGLGPRGLAFLIGVWPFFLGVEVGPSFSGLALTSRGGGGLSSPTSRVDGRQLYKMERSATTPKGSEEERQHPPKGERESTPPPTKGRRVELNCPSSDGVAVGFGLSFSVLGWPSSPPFMELGFGLLFFGLRLPFLLLSS